MKNAERMSLVATLAVGLCALSAVHGADALTEAADEIVVYGTATKVVLDDTSIRVDVKLHAHLIGQSLRAALGAKPSLPRVAAAEPRTRG